MDPKRKYILLFAIRWGLFWSAWMAALDIFVLPGQRDFVRTHAVSYAALVLSLGLAGGACLGLWLWNKSGGRPGRRASRTGSE